MQVLPLSTIASVLYICFVRSLKWSPLHNAAIHALSSRHEVYADTVRLFSYWAHSNMLSCEFIMILSL